MSGVALGTIWVVSHDDGHVFDAEDVRLMTRLADFTAAAFRVKRLEEALAESDRRKDGFIATLAHELNQPLAAIVTALELMKVSVKPAAGERARHVIERQTQHLQRLVNDLMDITRIAQGKLELRKQRIDIREIVADGIQFVTPHIEAHRHRLHVSLPDEPVWLDADAVRLRQVLSNLLTNAAKFTSDGGAIHVRVESFGDRMTLAVRDTGRGIAPNDLPHIFGLFRQSVDGQQDGLGIGLAVVRGLVEQHDGNIHVRSDGVGKGSEFVVTLPVAVQA